MKGRRVGTLTLGLVMVAAGILFLAWIFLPGAVDIWFCMKFWPMALILLGAEILYSWAKSPKEKLLYDGAAIVLLCFLLIGCFSVAVAWGMGEHFMSHWI